ncbi:MAG TPA: ABC transporter ATP-binding protein [Candidatus Saccharimonadales bacterium]|nr:ABC transporter ATP-binding protein [Candidatus Saccharimonadales bacterium]
MAEPAVVVDGVYKDFILPHEKRDSIKQAVTGIFQPKAKGSEVQHALSDIDFEVQEGEFFGIVGRNGSGKSTLLKMLAGIYQPTKGQIGVRGKLVPFIELGVGFNGELTGRENVYLNGALLGFSKKEIDAQYEQIVNFAELHRFMDQKLKNYSSGMQVRLAFSVAIMADGDILLVDEVLAVGDASFQRKCFEYFRLLKKNKKTVIFVTHDMNAVREYCDRALLIEKSRIVDIGTPDTIATQYTQLFNEPTKGQVQEKKAKRWGNKKAVYTKVAIGTPLLTDNNQPLTITAIAEVHEDIEDPIFGFVIRSQSGEQLMGTNSQIKRQHVGWLHKGDRVTVEWQMHNLFSDGVYYVDPAVTHRDNVTICDWWEEAAQFEVINEERVPYRINPPIKLSLKKETKD